MKLLWNYLKPFKKLLFISILLAALNQCFSLLDPLFAGKLLDKFVNNPKHFDKGLLQPRTFNEYLYGVLLMLGILITVAMLSRIAKAFQDYFSSVVIQKFGAKIFGIINELFKANSKFLLTLSVLKKPV